MERNKFKNKMIPIDNDSFDANHQQVSEVRSE